MFFYYNFYIKWFHFKLSMIVTLYRMSSDDLCELKRNLSFKSISNYYIDYTYQQIHFTNVLIKNEIIAMTSNSSNPLSFNLQIFQMNSLRYDISMFQFEAEVFRNINLCKYIIFQYYSVKLSFITLSNIINCMPNFHFISWHKIMNEHKKSYGLDFGLEWSITACLTVTNVDWTNC